MAREIIIDDRNIETRVAVLEDRKLEDLLFGQNFSTQIVGNIYWGRVEDVVPGIQAAFVNIGLDKNVFLPVNGVIPNHEEGKIEHVLQPGQKVLVQIKKDAAGDKGPKGSSKIELPGRYLILLDEPNHIGVSRKLPGEERGRLRKLAREIIPEGKGAILRTEAAGEDPADIKMELESLLQLRKEIAEKSKKVNPPALIYERSDLINQVIRDRFTDQVDKLVIDTEEGYQKIVEFVDNFAPYLRERIYYYQQPQPIFEYYDLEEKIKKLLDKEVELDCGGYIVIDPTEALTAVDVNTGTYKEDNIEDTVLQANLEAAREIPRQLRLRNISGIIVIDFIGMKRKEDKTKVLEVLEEELAKDKTRTSLLGMTELGLVEITRKRKKNSLNQLLQVNCPCCGGRGKVLSEKVFLWDIFSKLRSNFYDQDVDAVLVKLNPEFGGYLLDKGEEYIKQVEDELSIDIYLQTNPNLHKEDSSLESKEKEEVNDLLPLKPGDKLQVKVEKSLEDQGLTWAKGRLIKVLNGKELVGEEVKVEIVETSHLYDIGKVI